VNWDVDLVKVIAFGKERRYQRAARPAQLRKARQPRTVMNIRYESLHMERALLMIAASNLPAQEVTVAPKMDAGARLYGQGCASRPLDDAAFNQVIHEGASATECLQVRS
jgi:hypothetical protein